MTLAAATAPWLNPLLAVLQALQQGVLNLLHALGYTGDVHGQPAWPFASRIAADTLRLDLGLARQLGIALVMVGLIAVLLLMATSWRRRRPWWLFAAAIAAIATPWPPLAIVFTDANPTSFHASTTHFEADSILHGQAIYAAQGCAACHGDDGRGEGPLAATLPMWPPDLSRGLLWQRSDGDLFWHIRHGLRDRHGRVTMPALATPLTDADEWALIDYLQALAAGQRLARTGEWSAPVALPRMAIACGDDGSPGVGQPRGQRLRVVLATPGTGVPRPDPRVETLVVSRQPLATRPDADCVATSAAAWDALALVSGTEAAQLGGAQFLVDRDGWLRAVARSASSDWRDAELVCRSGDVPPAAGGDALGRLIAWMDAEPVQATRGGFRH